MYRISSDPRSAKSAELIWQGIKDCAKNKDFADISITDIQRTTGVSRSTFYRIFDNTRDVLQYACDQLVADVYAQIPSFEMGERRNFIEYFLKRLLMQADFLELVHSSNNMVMLEQAHRQHFEHILHALNIEEQRIETDYTVAILSAILPATLDVWVSRGRRDSAEELYAYIRQSLVVLTKLYS